MAYPEILMRWNIGDYAYFMNKDQLPKGNGITHYGNIERYDTIETIYYAIVRFLEYGYEHDMRIISDTSCGAPGVSRAERCVAFQYAMILDKPMDSDPTKYKADQLLFDAVATHNLRDKDAYYTNYVCLEVMCDSERFPMETINKVIFGNVNYLECGTPSYNDSWIEQMYNREGRYYKKIRFNAFIEKIRNYVRAHDGINAWLILQGITI